MVFSRIVGTFASDALISGTKVLIANDKPTQSKTAEKGGGSKKISKNEMAEMLRSTDPVSRRRMDLGKGGLSSRPF